MNIPNLQLVDSTSLAADPFDLASLVLPQDFASTVGVKKQLLTIPVRKPNNQDFVRVHPAEAYRAALMMVHLKDDREMYLVRPEMYAELSGETVAMTVFTAINRQGVLFLWPVRLPPPDGKTNDWWPSARTGAELAINKWIRLKASTDLGAYEIFEATSTMAAPEWPELPFQELLRIAFKDRMIDRVDHAVVKRLRGLS